MNLTSIAKYAQSRGLGMMGVDIFVNEMPTDTPGILIRSGYVGTPINHYLPGFREGSELRIAVRSKDYAAGYELAWKVLNQLTVTRDTQLDGMLMKQLLPEADPRLFRRTAGGYLEWEVEFTGAYVMT